MNKPAEFLKTHKISLASFVILLIAAGFYFGTEREKPVGKNPHAEHLKMIADIRSGMREAMGYEVNLNKYQLTRTGVPVMLEFEILDPEGLPVTDFEINNEKILHLIIVNDALTYFDHVHPQFDGKKFALPYTFPKDDAYRLYFDFKPAGKFEKQATVELKYGTNPEPIPDQNTSLSRTFGDYKVDISGTLKAEDINSGKSHLTFTITNAKTGEPVKDLRPYLGAFGHLVMINEYSYEYIHAHPINQTVTDDRSGPTVEFIPLSLKTGELAPGKYRLFAQFQPTSGLFTADFSVVIK